LEEADKPLALKLTSITKRFGSTLALDEASLAVRHGTIHALLGENGAGKTTMMHIAFGMINPDSGTLAVNGKTQRFLSPADAIISGIGMVHQHFTLVPAMTVAENIALGGRGVYNVAQVRARVRDVSSKTGFILNPDAVVGQLAVGAQQRVEIVKALAREARILILDEPTSVLTPGEARELLQNMRAFVENGGTVVLITHKLRDALEFTDDVTVIRRGRTILQERTAEVDELKLAEAMIGLGYDIGSDILGMRALRSRSSHSQYVAANVNHRDVFRLREVTVRDEQGVNKLKGVNLTVTGGEILGVAAIEGNGQYELLRVLAGRIPVTDGVVEKPDNVGFVPEDRQRDALILDFPLYQNIELFGAGQKRGYIAWRTVRDRTATLMQEYDIRAAGTDVQARMLSGGNQQKLVIGREITGAPDALVVENPTHGLDIQATATVHQRLRKARDHGAAIVLYSSDLDEVLELADRVIVLYNGKVYDVSRDREVIALAMLRGM
jgi:simple sugar transport system ATP-binding protein